MLIDSLRPLTLEPAQLLLDPNNPRLLGYYGINQNGYDDWGQEVLRRVLLKSHGVQDLVNSILRTGFLPLDRLVVSKHTTGRYAVVEGNRRVAAIKTILGDLKRRSITLPEQVVNSLIHVEVLLLGREGSLELSQARLIQGVRHISGVRSWGPYQQGYVIHVLVTKEGLPQREAALAVGLSPSRVSTLLHGYYGLFQLLSDPEFGPKADTSYFSHFEHAYRNLSVRSWLGWDEKKRCYMSTEAWSFFVRSILPERTGFAPKILARNVRDHLPAILDHPKARHAFLETAQSVEAAFALTQDGREYLHPVLSGATNLLRYLQADCESPFSMSESDLALIARLHEMTGKLLSYKTAE